MINPVSKSEFFVVSRATRPGKAGALVQTPDAQRGDGFTAIRGTHAFKPAKLADYVWHPSWALRHATAPNVPHCHGGGGGNVPIDLDEAANAAAVSANRVGLGIWFKLPILLVGIKYAWDGAVEAFETITHFAGERAEHNERIAQAHAAGQTTRAAGDVYRNARGKNCDALENMQRTAKREGDSAFALALPTFVGCVGMGGSLVCMADLLGGIIPAIEPLAESLMHVAVPAMCLFAAGMVFTSVYDQVQVVREYLAVRSAKIARAEQPRKAYDVQSIVPALNRELLKRSVSNFANGALAVSMGVGVYMLGAGALTGLWFMLPGALGLALAQWLRAVHVGHGSAFARTGDVAELGGKRQIVQEADHLSAHMQALRAPQLADKKQPASSRFKTLQAEQVAIERQFIGRQMALVASKRKRGASTKLRLQSLQTKARHAKAMQAWLGEPGSVYASPAHGAQAVVQTLHAHGLLKELALQLGRDSRFDNALVRSLDGNELRITNAAIYQSVERDPALFEPFCEAALGILTGAGYASLASQKRAVLALLTERMRAA